MSEEWLDAYLAGELDETSEESLALKEDPSTAVLTSEQQRNVGQVPSYSDYTGDTITDSTVRGRKINPSTDTTYTGEDSSSAPSILEGYQAPTPPPPEWALDVKERIVKSTQESFATILGGTALVADQIGAEGARDWSIKKADELFEKAANHDIVTTEFREISNPIDLAKFATESIIEYIPDLALMFAGGAGFATGGAKVATTVAGKASAKAFINKSLQKNLKVYAKSLGKDVADASVKEAAYKATLKQAGQMVGMASVEGFQGAGGMYLGDVDLRGADEATPWKAALGGVAQSAIAMVSPFNKALSNIAVGKGVTDVASMTIGEAVEEISQGAVELLHTASIDPNLTVGEVFTDPDSYWQLAEAGVVGAIVGGSYGGAARVVFGSDQEDSKVVDPADPEKVQESPSPKRTNWDMKADILQASLEGTGAEGALDTTNAWMQGDQVTAPAPAVMPTQQIVVDGVPTGLQGETPYPATGAQIDEATVENFEQDLAAQDTLPQRTEGPRPAASATEKAVIPEDIGYEPELPPAYQEKVEEERQWKEGEEKATRDTLNRFNTKYREKKEEKKRSKEEKKLAEAQEVADVDNEMYNRMKTLEDDSNNVNKNLEGTLVERQAMKKAKQAKVEADAQAIKDDLAKIRSTATGEATVGETVPLTNTEQTKLDDAQELVDNYWTWKNDPERGGAAYTSDTVIDEGTPKEVLKAQDTIDSLNEKQNKQPIDVSGVKLTSEIDSVQAVFEGSTFKFLNYIKQFSNRLGTIEKVAKNVRAEIKRLYPDNPEVARAFNERFGTFISTAVNELSTTKTGVADTGAHQWVQNSPTDYSTEHAETGETYRVVKDDADWLLVDSGWDVVGAKKTYSRATDARAALNKLEPLKKETITKQKELSKVNKALNKKQDLRKMEDVTSETEKNTPKEPVVKKKKVIDTTPGKPASKVKTFTKEEIAKEQAKRDKAAKLVEKAKEVAKKPKTIIVKKGTRKKKPTIRTKITAEDGRAYILEDLAMAVYKAGQSLAEFSKALRTKLGKSYLKIAGKIKGLYNKAVKALNKGLEKVTTGAEVGALGDKPKKTVKVETVKEEKVEAETTEEEANPVEPAFGAGVYNVFFQETPAEVEKKEKKDKLSPPEEEAKNRKYYEDNPSDTEKPTTRSKLMMFAKSAQELMTDIFVAETERIRAKSKKILTALRVFEGTVHTKVAKRKKEVKDFVDNFRLMEGADVFVLSMALRNGDTVTRDKILKQYKLEDSFKKVTKVLEEIEGESIDAGVLDKKVADYFPSVVKDLDGLIASYNERKGEKDFSYIEHEIEAANQASVDAGKGGLSESDKNAMIANLIAGGQYNYLPKPGATQQRGSDYVFNNMMKFYHSPSEALIRHIHGMTEGIEAAKMLGNKNTRRSDVLSLHSISKKIEGLTAKKELTATQKTELKNAYLEHAALTTKLTDTDAALNDSIAALVNQELKGKDATIVIELLQSRLKARGTYGAVSTIRNIAYAFALGSPTSAITQIGDFAWSFYRNGAANTFMGAGKAIKAMIDDKSFTKEHFDFTSALTEMDDMDTGLILDRVLTYTGLKYMDIFAKETAMQASLLTWSKESNKQQFIEDHTDMFGTKEKAEAVWKDIRNGTVNDSVLLAVFNDLSDYQPISLSEMPKAYQEAGNMRVFYMLKIFSIKALNNIVREVSVEAKAGNKVKAAKKLAHLVLLLAISGAGADELKDLLMGKEHAEDLDTRIQDNVLENMLQLILMNKYSMEKGLEQDQFITSAIHNGIPPARFADSFVADIYAAMSNEKDFKYKTLKEVPVVGRMLWSHSAMGTEANLSARKGDIYDMVRENVNDPTPALKKQIRLATREYNDDTREFNKTSSVFGYEPEEPIKRISGTSLKNVSRRERKKLRENK